MTSDALRPRIPPSGPFQPGAGGEFVIKVHEGTGIAVDNTDQQNPVVSNLGLLGATSGQGISVQVVDGIVHIATSFAPPVSAVLRLANPNADIPIPTAASPNTMVRCTALISDFTTTGDAAGDFTLGANAELTYTGADRAALVTLSTCVELPLANVSTVVSMCIDVNADTVGAAPFDPVTLVGGLMSVTMPNSGNSSALSMTTTRVLTLHTGDVLSPTVGAVYVGTPTNVLFEGFTMSVLLL